VLLSFAVATCGSAYWARRPGSRDLLFRDLMLWGWLRRLRTERRLAKATELLGVGHRGTGAAASDLVSERQVELLEQLAASLEARDPHTHGHTVRVTRHCEMIERFFRGSNATEQIDGLGLGLGLAICKVIVTAHGGRIEVDSDERSGTTFRVELPLHPERSAATLNTGDAAAKAVAAS